MVLSLWKYARSISAAFLLLLLGCPRSDTRAVISGRVQLANLAGANDLTRVSVGIGRGEGGATLDGDGNFEFADLEPDVYDLTITYAGGLDASSTGSAYQPYATKVAARAGGSVALGVIPLTLGVGTVRGTFTRTDQGGLAGLSVRLLGNGPALEEVSTNGSFEFPEVPVGRYQLFAARPGSAGVCGQMVVVGFHGAQVTVPTQMLQNATPVLTPGMGSSGSQAWSFDDTQWLLKAGSVNVMMDASFAGRARVWRAGSTVPEFAALQPSYLVDQLPAGNTVLNIQVEDRCGQEGPVLSRTLTLDNNAPEVTASLNGNRVFSDDATMVLTLDALEDLSFPLFMRRAVCEGAGGTAVCVPADLDNAPWVPLAVADELTFQDVEGVKSARVHVRDSSFNIWRSPELTVELDRSAPTDVMVLLDGRAAPTTVYTQRPWMAVVANDAVEMRWTLGVPFPNDGVGWDRFQSGVGRQIDVGTENGTVSLLVELRDTAFNVTRLPPLAVVVSNQASLQGRVVLSGLNSNAGARVEIQGTSFAATTNDAGEFTIPGVEAGEYQVNIEADGYRKEKLSVVLRAPGVTQLGDVTLTPAGGFIVGSVLLQGRSNHAGATVALRRSGLPDKVVTTLSGGNFRIPLGQGIYNDGLLIRHPLHADATYSQPMVVLLDQEFSVGIITLQAVANDVQGLVLVEGRADNAGVTVSLECQLGCGVGTVLSTTTSAAGTWTLGNVRLGQYLVVIQHQGAPALEVHRRSPVFVTPADTQNYPPVVLRQLFVHIDGEAPFTTNASGQVTLNTSTGCETMEVSNYADFSNAQSFPCAPITSWTLEGADGPKTVYVRFYPVGAMVPSETVFAQIILDRSAVLSSFTHDAPAAGASLGSSVTFTADGEPGAIVAVNIAGYASGIELRDDGRPPDVTAGDGRYMRTITVDIAQDLVAAATEAVMVDPAGNRTNLAGPAFGVVIPPSIRNVLLGVDTTARTVTVDWQTDEATTGTVRWWQDPQLPFVPVSSGSTGVSHRAILDASTLTPGASYSFVIDAVDTSGNQTTTQERAFSFAPSTPLFVAAIPGDGTAWVRWEGPSQRGVDGFHVYRALAQTGPFGRLTATPFRNDILMYQDTMVTNGVRYFYRVTTVDQGGNESAPSAIHDATPGPNMGPTVVDEQIQFDPVTVWSSRGSPYILRDDLAVVPGNLLVIGPGTTVLVEKAPPGEYPKYIRVEGRIAVLGARGVITGMTESDDGMVTIQSADAMPGRGDWAGFRIFRESPAGGLGMERSLGRYDAGTIFHRVRIRHGGAPDFFNTPHVVDVRGDPASGVVRDWRSSLYVSRVEISEHLYAAVNTGTVRDVVLRDVLVQDGGTAFVLPYSQSLLVQDVTVRRLAYIGSLHMNGEHTNYGLVSNLQAQDNASGLNAGGNIHVVDSAIRNTGPGQATAFGAGQDADERQASVARSTLEGAYLLTNSGTISNCQLRNAQYGTYYSNVFGSDYVDMGCNPMALDCTGLTGADAFAHRELMANTFSGGSGRVRASLLRVSTETSRDLEGAYNHFIAPLEGFPGLLLDRNYHGYLRLHSNTFLMPVDANTILAQSLVPYAVDNVVDVRGNRWDPATTAAMLANAQTDIATLDDLWENSNYQELAYSPPATGAFPLPRVTQPFWGQRFYVGDAITFEGSATDPEDGTVPPTSLHWYLNGTTPRGDGTTLVLNDLPAGTSGGTAVPAYYRMVLVVTDQDGQEARLPVHFQVWPAP